MSNNFRFPLATTTWDAREREAMHRVIDSGKMTMGEEVAAFEHFFAQYVGSRHAVMVNSGSSANLLMVAALFFCSNSPLRTGDEVIVPAVSWSTTYYPLHQYGLRLKFVDIDLETLNYDIGALARAVTEKTRLIMAVNLLGNPNDFYSIQRIIGDRPIRIIEDNCESLGAEFGGRKTGTFGVMGSYSSFFSHHISTMEGGVVTTDDEELHHILLALRAHGWTRNLPKVNRVCGTKSDDPFEESFRFVLPGYNVRPLELSGAIGIHQVEKLPAIIAARRRNAQLLKDAMGDHPELMIQREIGASSWFGFSLVVRQGSSLTRAVLRQRLDEIGIECRPIVAGNFTAKEVMRFFDAEVTEPMQNAEWIDKNGLFIGNHHYPLDDCITELVKAV
jgi:CDP-6-deoxy-D-xylo-4-hexulose-3-dehydrase